MHVDGLTEHIKQCDRMGGEVTARQMVILPLFSLSVCLDPLCVCQAVHLCTYCLRFKLKDRY